MDYSEQQKKAYNELKKRLVGYMSSVQSIYDNISAQSADIALKTDYDGTSNDVFSFDDYPEQRTAIQKMQNDFVTDLSNLIDRGVTKEWQIGNEAQNLLVNSMVESAGVRLNNFYQKKFWQYNDDALNAFKKRKDKGMSIQTKIWQQSSELKTQLEDTISVAIQRGMSAVTLSKRISQYLQNYPKLKQDYGEKFGTAIRCRDCEYKSIRLARTEINMSYRMAEQERWRNLDFVLGYRIKLSKNHTCNGMPFVDICDDLAGDYPKDFIWAGWHPSCRCYAIPILMSEAEFEKLNFGEPITEKPITEMPKQFDEWLVYNADRIEKAQERGTLPYFLKDNKNLIYFIKNEHLIGKRNLDTLRHNATITNTDLTPLYKELNKRGATEKSVNEIATDLFYETQDRLNLFYEKVSEFRTSISSYPDKTQSEIKKRIKLAHSEIKDYSELKSVEIQLEKKTKIFEQAKERHSKRTTKQIRQIQTKWNKKKLDDYFYPEKNPLSEVFMRQLDCKIIFTHDNTNSYYDGVSTLYIGNSDRIKSSRFEKINVLYHEGGHYIDSKYGLSDNKKMSDIFTKHRKILEDTDITTYFLGEQSTISRALYTNYRLNSLRCKLPKFSDKILSKYNITSSDLDEALLSVADTVSSLSSGAIGWGHTTEYISKSNNAIAEFIAHAFEIYHNENKLFKKLLPDVYTDMITFINNFYSAI